MTALETDNGHPFEDTPLVGVATVTRTVEVASCSCGWEAEADTVWQLGRLVAGHMVDKHGVASITEARYEVEPASFAMFLPPAAWS